MDAFAKYCAKFRRDPDDRAATTTWSCRPRTSSPRSAWCSARPGRSARLHVDVGSGHLAHAGAARHGLLRRDSRRRVRRAARRSLDGDAHARPAGRHPGVRLCVARRHQAHPALPRASRRMLRDGGRQLRPRRAVPDAGLRALRPRHRHERLGQPRARVGRLLRARPRSSPRRRRSCASSRSSTATSPPMPTSSRRERSRV